MALFDAFKSMAEGLAKTRENIMSGVDSVLKSFVKIDDSVFDDLEETLIMADMGPVTSARLIERVRERAKKEKVKTADDIKAILAGETRAILADGAAAFDLPTPSVLLIVGVNGVGKTTTIGKLAAIYKKMGKKTLIAAADTFRAAAIEQLEIWGERNGVDIIKHGENSDPGSVVYDAVQAAKARKTDVLIIDTAGRLHNKKNLMGELGKIYKIINNKFEDAHLETLLTLDATTGQNAVEQARAFKETANITGVILTKLDGTAKGGVIVSIKSEIGVPVRFVGIGEQIEDLRPFDPDEFTAALFQGR
ncbi:MAG: signal recognition particle-docking protein FtsY [Clostridiales bacterium]|jgi:fused signal recognition particle receptor|nr:signal recognition particle-docking protein FtsY [Clostridiales bacterium]